MMYVLAAWTGFRKGEIGSLTLRSLQLDDDPPTATVAGLLQQAASRGHADAASGGGPATEGVAGDQEARAQRAPVSRSRAACPAASERKAHKMIERDLMAARDKWIEEAETRIRRN